MWKGLTLEGEIVGHASVSPSPTLDKNEKVEHYIKMKDSLTHCLKVLGREWCQFLIWLDSYLIGVYISVSKLIIIYRYCVNRSSKPC